MAFCNQQKTKNDNNVLSDALALKNEVAFGKLAHHATIPLGREYRLEVRQGSDSLWFFLKRTGMGGLALRTAYSPHSRLQVECFPRSADYCEFRVASSNGAFRIKLSMPKRETPFLRCTVSLIPSANRVLPHWPRDLFLMDPNGDPTTTRGAVEVVERGSSAGLLYAKAQKPAFGSFLYLQNLTALRSYFFTTATSPEGAIGGEWPELGYQMPVSEDNPLPAGKEVVISDVSLICVSEQSENEWETTRRFREMLATIYRYLDKPERSFHFRARHENQCRFGPRMKLR